MGIYSHLEDVTWRELIHTKPYNLISPKCNAKKRSRAIALERVNVASKMPPCDLQRVFMKPLHIPVFTHNSPTHTQSTLLWMELRVTTEKRKAT